MRPPKNRLCVVPPLPPRLGPKSEILLRIEEIERHHVRKYDEALLHGTNVTAGDYMPPKLRRRVGRILGRMDDIENMGKEPSEAVPKDDKPVTTATLRPAVDSATRAAHVSKSFNESTLSEILKSHATTKQMELNIEPTPAPRTEQAKTLNWLVQMLRSKRSDRVKWQSKLYYLDRTFSQKNLYEQAEDMMDMAAENFSDWLAGLGHEHEVTLTKDIIKQLFSIGVGGDTSKALTVMPIIRKAVPHEVAQSLKMPQFSVENNVSRLMRMDELKKVPASKTTGFGRSLPSDLVVEKTGPENTVPMKPKFPDALRSKRNVFKGITHLRSTKTLVAHIAKHPNIKKPRYLVEEGCFKQDNASLQTINKDYVPLYAHFIKRS